MLVGEYGFDGYAGKGHLPIFLPMSWHYFKLFIIWL
jgi:hypothetical protein